MWSQFSSIEHETLTLPRMVQFMMRERAVSHRVVGFEVAAGVHH